MSTMSPDLIAPCGINCRLCSAYQRKKKPCLGCNSPGIESSHCQTCIIKNCPELAASGEAFCGKCAKYPCKRLKALEKRYRTKHNTNIFENLAALHELGMDEFLRGQLETWTCAHCGGILCMHRKACLTCGAAYRE